VCVHEVFYYIMGCGLVPGILTLRLLHALTEVIYVLNVLEYQREIWWQ